MRPRRREQQLPRLDAEVAADALDDALHAGPGRVGVVAERLGHRRQVRRPSVQPGQGLQPLQRPFQLPGAAADVLREPGQHVRADVQPAPPGPVLEEGQPAGGGQRLQADDQAAGEPAGQAGGQASQLPGPCRRGEDHLPAARPAVVDDADQGLDRTGRQVLHVLDHEQVALLRGGRPFLRLLAALPAGSPSAGRRQTIRSGQRRVTSAARASTRCVLPVPAGPCRKSGLTARRRRPAATQSATRRTAARAKRFSGVVTQCVNVYIRLPATAGFAVVFTSSF